LPPTATPTLPPANFRGLLRNGDFEAVQSGKPAYWSKVGGELRSSSEAYSGRYSACLDSDTASTKWLYQAVQVEPGAWYEATAWASASGGETFLRVTWYTTADGSGAGTDQADSQPATGDWAYLSTGPIQAPADARSARVRLMLRPIASAAACFDDAWFDRVEPPPATPTPTPKPTATPSIVGAPATRQPATAATPRQPAAPSQGTPTHSSDHAEAAPSPSLRIAEILADPPEPGRDAPYEWVEIVNISSQPIDLAGWTIGDATAADILPALLLPPGGYAVIAGSSADLPPNIAIARVSDGQIGNGIGNTGDLLRLRDPAGRIVDELSFGTRTDVFDPAPPAPEAGETLGLRNPHADPGPENWAITLEPTPGQPNRFPGPPGGATTPSQPAPPSDGITSRSATLFQIEEDNSSGSVLPWMVLGGLAGIAVGMLGAALARLLRRLRQRPPPPENGPDA
ncbi:lamin tail domain-containing protein, partial [Tepidiforma sp.]|uniref:lamin tail domain-containing protein n=1 Tax=Tepidiforma sp. TaxID=2682230 RepID=UPI002ADE5FCD